MLPAYSAFQTNSDVKVGANASAPVACNDGHLLLWMFDLAS